MEKTGLFVYGTLHPDRAPAEMRDVTQQFTLIGVGTVMGRLLDLGDYPGLILDSPPLQPVAGHVFAVPSNLLPALDAYEGFDPDNPGESLFLRREIEVTFENGRMERHWGYLFHGAGAFRFGA